MTEVDTGIAKCNTVSISRHITARLVTGSARMLNPFRRNTPNPAPAQPEAAIVPRIEGVHPLWAQDAVTTGTQPESVQTGTLRQLCRVIGRLLADTTPNAQQSEEAVKQSMAKLVTLTNIDQLLHGTIETITKAPHFNIATDKLTQHLRTSLNGVSSAEQLDVLVGLCRGAFNKMIDHQFSAPSIGRERVNGDQSMRTVFGFRGEVQQLELRFAQGALSRALRRQLREHSVSYHAAKEKLQGGEAIEDDSVFQVTIYAGSMSEEHYKVTGRGFRYAYFSALMKYAAVDYADRERGRARREEQPSRPKLGE